MKFICEYKSFYKPDQLVLIEYWYNPNIITPVKIVEKKGNKFLITHKISHSKIQNAPDEIIKSSDIIDIYRIKE